MAVASSNITEYQELVEFLSHKNVAVQSQALKILSSYSGDPDSEFNAFIQRDSDSVARSILRLVETDDRELVEDGLTCLVNLCCIDPLAESVIKLSGVRRICDSLNRRQVMVELHCMLLSNLTRLPSGVENLLSIPGIFKGVLLKYSAVDSEDVDHLGSVIVNGTSLEKGRKIVCDLQTDSQGYTHCLLLQCLARCLSVRRRRTIALNILRNIALDTDCHDAIAASGVIINMCYFLYPETEDRREDDVHKSITENSLGLASDVETRSISAEILVCFLRTEVGRDVMRSVGVYEVVRLWDLEESEQSIKDMIYDVAMATHLNEDELKTGELQDQPDRVVEL
jgi:hypothetical protein